MESLNSEDLLKKKCFHPYTKALLDASPSFGSHYSRERLKVIQGKVPDPRDFFPGCPFALRCGEADNNCKENLPLLKGNFPSTVRCFKAGI